MGKKIIVILIILAIILAIIFGLNIFKKSKVEYEIQDVKSYNYFKFVENEKVGVIDREGKILVPAKYESIIIPNPEKDVFICSDTNEKVTLNSSNEKIFTKYDGIYEIKLQGIISDFPFEKNTLIYEKDGLYGLIDFDGKEKTKNIYEAIENLQSTEGKILVKENGKLGVVNGNGIVLVKTNYDEIRTDGYYSSENKSVYSGFIVGIKTDEGIRYGYIKYDGKIVLNPEFNGLIRVTDQEEIYLIVSKEGREGLYKDSKKIVDPEYQSISYSEIGNFIVNKNKKYGIMDLKGELLVDTKYTGITTKGIYLYAESPNENSVYDSKGNKKDISISKAVYKTENENYRIIILNNNNSIYYGIESADEKELVKPLYSYIEYISGEYFIAKKDNGNLGIINSKGRIIIDFKYDTLQKLMGTDMLYAINEKTKETEIYSRDMKVLFKMKDATVEKETLYTKIFNNTKTMYIDNEGNELKIDSEELQSAMKLSFPDQIGEYTKIQSSLNDVHYEKK